MLNSSQDFLMKTNPKAGHKNQQILIEKLDEEEKSKLKA